MKAIVKDRWYWLTLLLGVAVFYVLNLNTCMWADDYEYSLMPTNLSERCDSLAKYFSTMYFFYIDTNGRIADMILRFIDSLLGKAVFNVLNTIVFGTFAHTLSRLVGGTERRAWVLVMVYLFLLVVFPVPGETLMWMSGAVNYLWTATATILLLLYITRRLDAGRSSGSVWHHMGIAVGAFVAGGMNESFSAAMIAAMVCYFVLYRKELRGTHITVLVAYGLGMMVILLSPAAWSRLETGNSVNLNMGLGAMLLQRSMNLVTKTGHFVTPFLGIVTVAILCWCKGIKATSHSLLNWTLVGAAMSVFVFGVYQQRAYSCYSLMGFIALMAALAPMINHRPRVAMALCTVASLACIIPATGAIKTSHDYKAYSDSVITQVINSPHGVVPAARKVPETRFYMRLFYDNSRATTWNKYFSYYYCKDNVQFLSDSAYAHYIDPAPLLSHATADSAYVSNNPSIATTLYTMGDARFAVVPILCDSAVERQGLAGRIYYADMTAHLGADRASKRKMWGVLKDYDPFPQYHIHRDGCRYVVLPAINDSIVQVDILMKVAGRNHTLTFTRQ